MLKSVRNIANLRLWCLFMALYLLNFSVDTSDLTDGFPNKTVPYDSQESIIELIVEKVLGYQNAIPEVEENDTDEPSLLKKNISVEFLLLTTSVALTPTIDPNSSAKNILSPDASLLKASLEIHSPPPEF